MKFQIPANITRAAYKLGLELKKHSPEILLVTGVVGTVASAILACKATTKLSGVLEDTQQNLNDIKDYVETTGYSEQYTAEDHKKDTVIIYTKSAMEMVKLYAPAVALGAVSIASILTAHNVLNKRYLAASAAYTAVENAFKQYRGRVVERFGKELDHELKYNIKAKEVDEIVVNEDGSETVNTKVIEVADNPNEYSPYARVYDDGCIGWEKDAEHNRFFLQCQQTLANQKLQAQGYLFLNEVYKMLGIPESKVGQLVGWVYDEAHPVGDNYVDFGIFDTTRPTVRNFINGYERTVILDFNVDGNILELMP